MYPPSRHIAPRKPALEPPFHCSHFPAVIVQVQGRVGVILDSGEGNETTRFHHRPRRRERPCCGTTEKRDEFSSLHDRPGDEPVAPGAMSLIKSKLSFS